MNIKIISDGTRMGTEVVNVETGEAINGVVAIDWSIKAGRAEPLAMATITIMDVQLELTGQATVEMLEGE